MTVSTRLICAKSCYASFDNIKCGTGPRSQKYVFLKSSHSEFFHRQNLFTYPKMAAPAPPTQDSNLRGMAVSSISSVTFAVGANLVCLRMYVRMKRHITGWDDYTICVALVNTPSLFLTTERSTLLTRTGTVSLRNGGRRLPNCEWRWQAYRYLDTRTAVRVHQVDFCCRGWIRHRHLLCQDLRVYLHSTLHQ